MLRVCSRPSPPELHDAEQLKAGAFGLPFFFDGRDGNASGACCEERTGIRIRHDNILNERVRETLALALPIIAARISQNALNLVDTAMVGTLGDAAPAPYVIGPVLGHGSIGTWSCFYGYRTLQAVCSPARGTLDAYSPPNSHVFALDVRSLAGLCPAGVARDLLKAELPEFIDHRDRLLDLALAQMASRLDAKLLGNHFKMALIPPGHHRAPRTAPSTSLRPCYGS